MPRYLFLLSYFLTLPVFAIYDLVAVNITPSQVGTTFGFQMDTSQTEMYLALYIDGVGFQSILRTKTGELQFAPLQDIKPFLSKSTTMPVGPFGPFTDDTLRSVKLYAGTKAAIDKETIQKEYTQIFNYGIPTLTKEEKPWTVMVYMVGSSLERQIGDSNASDPEKRKTTTKGYASKDILEMLAGTRQSLPNSVNVVLATGGSSREGWKTVKYSLIRDGQLYVLQDLGEQKMSNPQTLSNFVVWAKDNFPAQHHALVLWNHGGGTQGFGQDTSQARDAKMMSLDQLHDAYQTIRTELGKPLELVIYDACVMASIEVAEVTATVANAMAGSAETEPEHGIDYTSFLSQLSTTLPPDGITLGKIVKAGYIQQTKEKNSFNTSQITYSVLDLTQLPQLWETFGQFATELKTVFTDSSFLTTEMLSRGIIRAPGYPAKDAGELPSLDRGAKDNEHKTFRIDLYNVLQTVSPEEEFQQLKSYAEALQTSLQQLVVDYEVNDRVKTIDPEAGRISLDIGSEKSYLSVLPAAYTQLSEALDLYNQKRKDITAKLTGKFTCPDGKICADAKWWNLKADEVINIDGYYGQQAEQGVDVYLIKSLYRYRPLEETFEQGVNGQEACQYQLCASDTECSNLTVTESQGLWLADVVYNDLPAILTLCPDDNATWKACSVLPRQDSVWGRDEPLAAGDTVTPTVLHLQDGELTQQHSPSLVVGETVPVVKQQCDMQTAVIIASYFGNNYKPQFERLCDKGDCVCQENDQNESCISTNNQFRAGVRIEVR